MCYDLSEDGTLGGTFVIDTCADAREKLLTRLDLGHKDCWHFFLEKDTCVTVLFHELDKLKYLSCMFIDDTQQDGWINLLRRGCSADSWPESLKLPACISQITPPGIPFSKVFLEGHTMGMDAHSALDSATAAEKHHKSTFNIDVPSELFAVGRADTYECVDADENGVQSWRKCNITSIGQKDVVVDILRPKREENIADDRKLGGPQTQELTWHNGVTVDPNRLRVVPSAATGGMVGSPQAAGPTSSSSWSPAPPSGSAGASIFVPKTLEAVAPRQLLQVVTSISLKSFANIPTLKAILNQCLPVRLI
jgi:hypothetical protein